MFSRSVRFALIVAVCAATTSLTSVSHALPPTELIGDGNAEPMKDAATISTTKWGYRYRAGQQNSHLVITQVGDQVRYVDTGTKELREIPGSCRREQASRGIAVSCTVPAKYSPSNPIFLEVWPRLGDDFVDGSDLSATFRLWALVDAGRDTVFGGAGDDFVNGAQDGDRVRGGPGKDWLRTGIGNDVLWGGTGNDRLVALDGADDLHGGEGDDQVSGANGNDELWGGAGADRVSCGSGSDTAWLDSADKAIDC